MIGPGDQPPIPNLPTGAARMSADGRRRAGETFTRTGDDYHAVRPGYPGWVTDFFLEPPAGRDRREAPARALDLGAGTGLYTRDLVARGLDVTALEPSDSMRQVLAGELPDVAVVPGRAEDVDLPDGSFDLVTVAQAWHWMDPDAVGPRVHRWLRAGGVFGLVWNQLDVTEGWVHRLARIMHSGDVQRDPATAARVSPGIGAAEIREAGWTDTVTPERLVALCHSRSYWLKSSDAVRAKVDANLEWYLHQHLGLEPGQDVELPYTTLAVRYRRH